MYLYTCYLCTYNRRDDYVRTYRTTTKELNIGGTLGRGGTHYIRVTYVPIIAETYTFVRTYRSTTKELNIEATLGLIPVTGIRIMSKEGLNKPKNLILLNHGVG